MSTEKLQVQLPEMSMIKLDLQIELINLQFDICVKQSHFVHLSIQNKEQGQLSYDQIFIKKSQKVIELDKMSPLSIQLVIGPDKNAISPYDIFLTSKLKNPIKRNIPINAQRILQHYLNHELFQKIKPLEQVFNFDGGKLTYLVHISQVNKMKDVEQLQTFSSKFKFIQSTYSSSKITSHESQKIQRGRMNVNYTDEQYTFKGPLPGLPKAPSLHSKTSLHNMSVKQIADQLQIHRIEEGNSDLQRSVSKLQHKFIELNSQEREKDGKELQKSSNLKFKLVALLFLVTCLILILGMFGLSGDDSKKRSKRMPKRNRIKK